MAKEYELRQECWRCHGDGVAEIPTEDGERVEDPCMICDGEGYTVLGYLEKI